MIPALVEPVYAFEALALDYDGTLATTERPADEVLAALAAARRDGLKLLLVTGRIMNELRASFPDVEEWFDAVVAENGAVIEGSCGRHKLAPAVERGLADAIERRGVPVRRGDVLLACDAVSDSVVIEEVHRLGLECQLLYNRSALMVLPAGVAKGTGLQAALDLLGLSRHNTMAVGDAENDHSLLECAEFGVAVANAVDSLKDHADFVLPLPDGAGVMSLLQGPELRGEVPLRSPRRTVAIGETDDGSPVRIPASHTNVLVAGTSRSGKSFLGGLYVEQLIDSGYTVLVIDYEGDHDGLLKLRRVVAVGGERRLPEPSEISATLRQFVSVVVDLSMLSRPNQDSYVRSLTDEIVQLRRTSGLPHWLVIDEAHRSPASVTRLARSRIRACCLITWRPDQLLPQLVELFDIIVLAVGLASPNQEVLEFLARRTGQSVESIRTALGPPRLGRAVMLDRHEGHRAVGLTVGDRHSRHVRHWRKYAQGDLPERLRFVFRRSSGSSIGVEAANLRDLERIVSGVADDVLQHHLPNNDLSRWASQALQDSTLATALAEIEGGFAVAGDVALARSRILDAIRDRY